MHKTNYTATQDHILKHNKIAKNIVQPSFREFDTLFERKKAF